MTTDPTLEVLKDLMLERGQPAWMAVIAAYKDELTQLLHLLETGHSSMTVHQCPCYEFERGGHEPRCTLGKLLRAIGGAEETQKQVNCAHGTALQLSIRERLLTSAVDVEHMVLQDTMQQIQEAESRAGYVDLLTPLNEPHPSFKYLPGSKVWFR